MGIELLEEKYQRFCSRHPQYLADMQHMAEETVRIQTEMRRVLDRVVNELCPQCKAPCCQCLPVEGWFTESDYFLYRMRYAVPLDLRVPHGLERACAFLGPEGCVLQQDLRPFPCVKVNCDTMARTLAERGELETFKALYDRLDAVQEAMWPLVREIL